MQGGVGVVSVVVVRLCVAVMLVRRHGVEESRNSMLLKRKHNASTQLKG